MGDRLAPQLPDGDEGCRAARAAEEPLWEEVRRRDRNGLADSYIRLQKDLCAGRVELQDGDSVGAPWIPARCNFSSAWALGAE